MRQKVSSAPVVLAKGEDYLAQKIKEVARENKIEIVENKPLARMLYHNVDVGAEIPPELYQAVAVYACTSVVHERPKAITGTQTVSALETDAGSHPVDGVFILRDAIAPLQLVPGLATEENHVKVNLQMETNLPGLFACGDITGKPYQYIKAAGQGNVAALSAAEYLDKKKRDLRRIIMVKKIQNNNMDEALQAKAAVVDFFGSMVRTVPDACTGTRGTGG